MPRVKGQVDVKKRRVYMTEKVKRQDEERAMIQKQCQERNKFLDVKETFYNNEGDLI